MLQKGDILDKLGREGMTEKWMFKWKTSGSDIKMTNNKHTRTTINLHTHIYMCIYIYTFPLSAKVY